MIYWSMVYGLVMSVHEYASIGLDWTGLGWIGLDESTVIMSGKRAGNDGCLCWGFGGLQHQLFVQRRYRHRTRVPRTPYLVAWYQGFSAARI